MSVDRRYDLFGSFVRFLTALAVPLCFIWAISSLVGMAAGLDFSLLQPWHYAVLAAVGAGKMALNRLFPPHTFTVGTVVREIVLALAGAGGLACLVTGTGLPFPDWPSVNGRTIYAFLALLAQWFLAFRLDAILLERARVSAVIEGDAARAERPEDLKRSPLIGELAVALGRVKFILALLVCVAVAFLIVMGWITRAPGVGAVAATAVFLSVVLIDTLCLNLLREEQRRYSDGLFAAPGARRLRIVAVIPLLALSVIFALLAAGGRPLLDLSFLASGRPDSTPTEREPPLIPAPEEKPFSIFADLKPPDTRPRSAAALFLDKVLYVFAGALAVCFLFYPVFSKGFRKALAGRHPLVFIKLMLKRGWERMRRLAAAAGEFVFRLFGRKKGRAEARSGRDGSTASGGAHPGRDGPAAEEFRKVREANRILRQFRRLQRWAAGKKLPYRIGQTAVEYLDEIAGRYPAERERLGLIVEIFERALFSTHLLSHEELRRYGENVRAVTRAR